MLEITEDERAALGILEEWSYLEARNNNSNLSTLQLDHKAVEHLSSVLEKIAKQCQLSQ